MWLIQTEGQGLSLRIQEVYLYMRHLSGSSYPCFPNLVRLSNFSLQLAHSHVLFDTLYYRFCVEIRDDSHES